MASGSVWWRRVHQERGTCAWRGLGKVGLQGSRRLHRSSLDSQAGRGVGPLVSLEGFLLSPSPQVMGDVGGVPSRDRTGEAQVWGWWAGRRVGVARVKTRMWSPLPPEPPGPGMWAGPIWGPQGAFIGQLGLLASGAAHAHGLCRGQCGFTCAQGGRAHDKHRRQVGMWPPCRKVGRAKSIFWEL